MKFIRVNSSNIILLEQFVAQAGKSLDSFRYFSSRPFTVIENHLCTWVIEEDGDVKAYGHLDREGETIWLGIAVKSNSIGKGLGRIMMGRLMASASSIGLSKVKLAVDHVNEAAIKLYEQFDFQLIEKKELFGFYEWQLPVSKQAVISSLAFAGLTAENIIDVAKENNFILEFSSGMAFSPELEELFLNAPIKRFAHNYFPAPEIPFVLNLGSGDEEIRRKSISHCVRGIQLSFAVGAPFFSAHAGFCVDPQPAELGKELSKIASFDRAKHWHYFLASIREVLHATLDLPTGFLLENNVLAKMNVYMNGLNPLLNVEADEMLLMIEEIADSRCGILFDTAHLKVSANTLNFNLAEATQKILPFTRCIHHSDNDGLQDNNKPFDENYWFLPFLKQVPQSLHVLEVRKQSAAELKGLEKLLFSKIAF